MHPRRKRYSYIAEAAGEVIFYRLKMENIDGKLTDSNIIRLARSKSATVSIYPNPVHDNLIIDMSQARPAVIHVIDLNRRIYKVIAVNASSTLIDVNDLGKVYTS